MSQIEEQLVDSSRMVADIVVAYIGGSQDKFDEVITIMQKDEYPNAMRASRVAYLVFEKHQSLIRKHIPALIKMLSSSKVDGTIRSVLKILAETTIHISDDNLGELTELAFNFVENPRQPIAIRACGIDVLIKITRYYPEIKPELIAVLEDILPESSVGLKGKCKKVLKKMQ